MCLSVNCPNNTLTNEYPIVLDLHNDAVDGSLEQEDERDASLRNLVTQLNDIEAEESKSIVLYC
jgi:hypothetical protein